MLYKLNPKIDNGKYNYNIVDKNGNLRKTVQDVINEHINPGHIRITSMDREA